MQSFGDVGVNTQVDITVFLGAPGSGKGTQAKILAKQYGFIHLSTGDMLRAAIQKETGTGLRAKSFIDSGNLVPDGVMIELIEKTLADLPSSTKVILDGFPRTVAQAEALDGNDRTCVDRAVYFDVPSALLMERLTGRRICSKCGQPYHATFLPPKVKDVCDACGNALLQRPDDTEGVVKRRLEVFTQQNQPLLDFYRNASKLESLNADTEVDLLQSQLVRALN
jgi:adenylate kinase